MIEATRPPGLLALLDEECLMPRGSDDSFARKLYTNMAAHPRFETSSKNKANSQFVVLHYAGAVVYDTNGWLEKNKDAIQQEAMDLVGASSVDLIALFFKPTKDAAGEVGVTCCHRAV